jgi:hypothetical protein
MAVRISSILQGFGSHGCPHCSTKRMLSGLNVWSRTCALRMGSTVGAWYYAVFPVSASAGLVAATTGAMLAAVGMVTALAWIVLDPLLATTGIHRRRLDRFVIALGQELRGGRRGDYRVRDHYLARVVDVLDILRGATTAFS